MILVSFDGFESGQQKGVQYIIIYYYKYFKKKNSFPR
jgi:hypothetical protein